MDEREAALARSVAETVDAWLRDPRDPGLYVRLLTAVELWRKRLETAVDGQPAPAATTAETVDGQPAENGAGGPARVSAATALLIEKLRALQAEAHKREHPDEASTAPADAAHVPGDTIDSGPREP